MPAVVVGKDLINCVRSVPFFWGAYSLWRGGIFKFACNARTYTGGLTMTTRSSEQKLNTVLFHSTSIIPSVMQSTARGRIAYGPSASALFQKSKRRNVRAGCYSLLPSAVMTLGLLSAATVVVTPEPAQADIDCRAVTLGGGSYACWSGTDYIAIDQDGDLDILLTGDIGPELNGDDGVIIDNSGGYDLLIRTEGNTTGGYDVDILGHNTGAYWYTNGHGLEVTTSGGGDIAVHMGEDSNGDDVANLIKGYYGGIVIYAYSASGGSELPDSVYIDFLGDVIGNRGPGILATASGDIDIYVDGDVIGDNYHYGAAWDSGSVGTYSAYGSINIEVTGDARGSAYGIAAYVDSGGGDIDIYVGGTVAQALPGSDPTYWAGVRATTDGGDVTIKTSDVYSWGNAIEAYTQTADIDVTVASTLYSEYYDGINLYIANTGGGGGYANVSVDGDIIAGRDGAYVRVDGLGRFAYAGGIDIGITGDITGTIANGGYTGGYGVFALLLDAPDGTGITVDVGGDIYSVDDGIHTEQFGFHDSADTNITVDGNITSKAGDAIYSKHYGDGEIHITTTDGKLLDASGYGIGGGGHGIYVFSYRNHALIDVNSYADIDADPGIYTVAYAAGYSKAVTDIDVTGTITATDGAIRTLSARGQVEIYVDANIEGDSDTQFDSSGAVKGFGIYVNANHDPYTYTAGAGAVDIRTTDNGNIVGYNISGIVVLTDGGNEGVGVAQDIANVYIDADGDIGAKASGGYSVEEYGIRVVNSAADADYGNITITGDGNIYAGEQAILAQTYGKGAITIDFDGNVNSYGTDADDDGITAYIGLASSTADITVETGGNVSAIGGDAINATTSGSGNVSVTTSGGELYSLGGDGIDTYTAGGDITIASGSKIVLADPGITAKTIGSGDIEIDVTASITADDYGITVEAEDGTVDIYVDATVEGDDDEYGVGDAINVDVVGTGSVKVVTTSDGDIVGHNEGGIRVTVAGGDGFTDSIDDGRGNILIEAGGDIGTSTLRVDQEGIYARNFATDGTGGDITIRTAGNIYSHGSPYGAYSGDGISAWNDGTGAVEIETAAGTTINAEHDDAIQAISYGGAIVINAQGDLVAGTSVGDNGAEAYVKKSDGNVTITVDGSIEGSGIGKSYVGNNGIFAKSIGGDVTATANGTIYAGSGIYGYTTGTGTIDLESNAAIYADGTYADTWNGGIKAVGADGTVTINANDDITSAADGIYASSAAGDIKVTTADGKAITADGYGIDTSTTGGGNITVTAGAGSTVTGGAGYDGINATAGDAKGRHRWRCLCRCP